MGRQPCCDKVGLKRGPWTIEEDHKLMNFILSNGIHCWRMVPKLAGLLRCGKSCRLRWINYLRPDLKRGALTETEENQIIQLHSRLGNRWSKIAAHFPGRTDNEIKNHWNTRIKKRMKNMGLDSVNHKLTEQNGKINDKTESSSSKDEESLEVKYTMENLEKGSEVELTSDVTNNLIDNFDLVCGTLDMSVWLNGEANKPNYTSSSTFSLDPSMDTAPSSSIQQDSLQQWVDSVDSFLSWDGFNHLEEDFLFLKNSQ